MKYGLVMFPTDEAMSPHEVARAAEDHGFESLFFTEHSHIPVSHEPQYPDFPGRAPLPRRYQRIYDPFVALSAAAAVTSRLRLGTGICLVVQRDPIQLAKETASLDRLSGGRFLFGVGAGWNRLEMANHGTDPDTRHALLAERVAAIRTIWTREEASFHGRFVSFDAIWSWPKPIQPSGPPVLLGGNGPRVIERVVTYADGWFPTYVQPDYLRTRLAELDRRTAEVGREPIPVTLFGAESTPQALETYQELGVNRLLFPIPPAPATEILPVIETIATRVAAFN